MPAENGPSREPAPLDRLKDLGLVHRGSRFESVVLDQGVFYGTMRVGLVVGREMHQRSGREFVTVELRERGGERLRESRAPETPVIDWGPEVRSNRSVDTLGGGSLRVL